jgi:transcriptional regulator with GAF, ATPase, and Fis domain
MRVEAMKRRSRTGGEPNKGRRRKMRGPKRRNAPKAVGRSSSRATGKPKEVPQLAREPGEALERQTATTELLQVINSSCGDLQSVFQTMLARAVRLCQVTFGVLWLAEGDRFRSVALYNLPPAFAAARQREPVVFFSPKSGTGRLIEKKQIFQIEDLKKDSGYIERDPRIIPLVELGGARTALFAPLLQKNHVIGSLVLYRQEVCPFGDTQIAFVENFAAQAVIAIENARLLNELRQRTEQVEAQARELAQLNQQLEQRVSDQVGEIERMGRLRRFLPLISPRVLMAVKGAVTVESVGEFELKGIRRPIAAYNVLAAAPQNA